MKAVILTEQPALSPASDTVAQTLEARGYQVERRSAAAEDSWDVVVCWDAHRPESKRGGIVINPLRAVRMAQSLTEGALLLHLHGIPVAPELLPDHTVRPLNPPPSSEYTSMRVHIGDLRVLAVEEDTRSPGEGDISRLRYQRMMEAACRSVYVLGLHFACVHLHVHPHGGWRVAAVDPCPRVATDLARAYGSSIAHLAGMAQMGGDSRTEAILGADPEFALATSEGKLLYASRYVGHRGLVGFDRQSRARRGAVYPLAEIRPHPSPSPLVLAANTEQAMYQASQLLPTKGTRWYAGSCPLGRYPTGGHLHISGIPLSTPVLAALDNYLALPMMLLEQRSRAKRRRRRYGRLGDFRRKEHGGFEYRALASWLVCPQAARATLCLAKVVAAEWPRLSRRHLAAPRVIKEFYLGKKGRFRHDFSALWRNVLRTPTGRQYEYELSYLPRMVTSGREWRDDHDIKEAWWK